MDDSSERKGTLWTLHIREDGTFQLYVSCMLGEAFGPGNPQVGDTFQLDSLDQRVAAAARDLYAETANDFPPAPQVRTVRGVPLKSSSVLHVNHSVDWPDWPRDHLVLTREVTTGAWPEQARHVDRAIAAMSPTGRRATRELDDFALAASRRLVDEWIHTLSGQVAPDAAPAKPWRAFISYRRAQLVMAKSLHAAFGQYGNGAFFDPYLDEHELAAGELEARLTEAITTAPLFIAVATAEYAAAGSWSQRELKIAEERKNVITPVLVGDERPREWPSRGEYWSVRFRDAGQLHVSSPEFVRLAEGCLRAMDKGDDS